jgi:hypothetical protein
MIHIARGRRLACAGALWKGERSTTWRAMLDDFYFADPRLTLVPIEHLSRHGIAPGFAALLAARPGWSAARVDLLDSALRLYWERLEALAQRGRDLSPPRVRNIGVVHDPSAVRPYASILNTSTATLYESDLDPEISDPEFVAYLLAHEGRVAEVGEVTLAAVHLASWWFERGAAERDAFRAAAKVSPRPDAATYRAIADALPWLRELRHQRLRPPRKPGGHRSIPGTGLLVPRAVEQQPDRLMSTCRDAATSTLEDFYARWRAPDASCAEELLAWLAADVPPVLVTDGKGAIVWDPEQPDQLLELRAQLENAAGIAVREIAADLGVIAEHTRRFLAALRDPDGLPRPDPTAAQAGYAYMHASRRLIAYNLHERGIERLAGPALPYARAMLGARTIHEWSHLGVDAGLVPRTVDDATWAQLTDGLARLLDETITRAPRALAERCASDLRQLSRDASPGTTLTRIFASRLPDYRSNLLGFRFLTLAERETYVRQNVRPLAREFEAAQLWRLLVRFLYEYQYLAFSAVADRRAYFLATTWIGRDLFACRALDEARFDDLAAAAGALCAAHAVDESQLQPARGR